jgi:hypothetical protein
VRFVAIATWISVVTSSAAAQVCDDHCALMCRSREATGCAPGVCSVATGCSDADAILHAQPGCGFYRDRWYRCLHRAECTTTCADDYSGWARCIEDWCAAHPDDARCREVTDLLAPSPDATPPSIPIALTDADARSAFAMLARAERYEDTYVGPGGSLSTPVAALRRLVHEPNALAIVDELYGAGTIVGRLYALNALWFLSAERFEQARAELDEQGDREIETLSGCQGALRTVHDVLRMPCRVRTPTLAPGASRCDLERVLSSRRSFCSGIASGADAISMLSAGGDRCGHRVHPTVRVAPDGSLCAADDPTRNMHWLEPCPTP